MPRLPMVAIATFLSATASAGVVLESDVSARAQGMAGAVVADSDDVHAIYYNPAGLRFLSAPDETIGQIALHGALHDWPKTLDVGERSEVEGVIGGGGRGYFSFALGIYSTGITPLLRTYSRNEGMSLDRTEWAAAVAWHNDWFSFGSTLAIIDLTSPDDDRIEGSQYGLTLGTLASPVNAYFDAFNTSINYQMHLAAVGKTKTEVEPFGNLFGRERDSSSVVARAQTLTLGINQEVAWMTGFGALSLGLNAEISRQKYGQVNNFVRPQERRTVDLWRQAGGAEFKLAAPGGPTVILRTGAARLQDESRQWLDETRQTAGLGIHGPQWGIDLAASRLSPANKPDEVRESFSATVSRTW